MSAPDDKAEKAEARSRMPTTLLVLGAFLFVALALHERLGGRLSLPRLQGAR